jgi:hypothetical protein
VVTPWLSSSVLVFVLCLCSFVGCRGLFPTVFVQKNLQMTEGLYIAQHVDRTVVIEEE